MGRKKLYDDTSLYNKITEFIKYCQDNDIIPDDYTLIEYLGISARTLDRYFSIANNSDDSKLSDDDLDKSDIGSAIKKLVMYREHYNMVEASKNPKAIGHINFRVKQGRWGNWTDRQDVKTDSKIDVNINTNSTDPFA